MSPTTFSETISASSSIANSAEIVLQRSSGNDSHVNFEVVNGTAVSMTAFELQLKDHKDGEFYTYLSGADWATATANMQFCTSSSPATLTTGSKAHAHIRIGSAYSIRFRATLASSTGTVTVRGSAQQN